MASSRTRIIAKSARRNFVQRIEDLSISIGGIDRSLKALLLTDGSVTRLMSALFDDRVGIETLHQLAIIADEELSELTGFEEGDVLNERLIRFVGRKGIFGLALSYCKLDDLPSGARKDLMNADIPIGEIIRKHGMEIRRDIKGFFWIRADEELSKMIESKEGEIIPGRFYDIYHAGRRIFRIYELFHISERPRETSPRAVLVETPSRIHITLIDMSGDLGRVDGGIGLALRDPKLRILVERIDDRCVLVEGERAGTLEKYARLALSRLGISSGGLRIRVLDSYPEHVGLGSGTQSALAIASSICKLYGIRMGTRDLARLMGRGGTSGIGVAAFEYGGFILDGGHSFGLGKQKESFLPSRFSPAPPPPIVARYDFPPEWNIVLAIPEEGKRISGEEELRIFKERCPIDRREVEKLSRLILMKLIPSILERDIESFGESINEIQKIGFKKIEVELQPDTVREIMREMIDLGASGSGLSSFGPTVYGIFEMLDENDMKEIERRIRDISSRCTVLRTSARNRGADLECIY